MEIVAFQALNAPGYLRDNYDTLAAHKIRPAPVICPGRAHGISIRTQEAETPDEVCRAWLPLCKTWLSRQFQ